MKSRRFVLTTGLGFTTVLLLGCAQKSAQQPDSMPMQPASTASTASGDTAQAKSSEVLRSGDFVSGEHPTQGTVRIVNRAGKRMLELDSAFKTSSSGPDLVVILHRSADVIGSSKPPAFPIQPADWLLLAPLKQFSGAQSYEIPETVNLDEFQSAAIWCRQFNATFGAASLKA